MNLVRDSNGEIAGAGLDRTAFPEPDRIEPFTVAEGRPRGINILRHAVVCCPECALDQRQVVAIVDRPYQHEAIRRVAEAFEAGKRRALLVMATGTGKTRTTMALIDVFLQANQARNMLFLADRDALVDQALTDGFKRHHLRPNCACASKHTKNSRVPQDAHTQTSGAKVKYSLRVHGKQSSHSRLQDGLKSPSEPLRQG